MRYHDVFGDLPANEAANYVIGLIGFYYRSLRLEEIASYLGMNQKIDFFKQIGYEANDYRTLVVTAFNPKIDDSCIGTLEKAIQMLPDEYLWMKEVIGSYPTHYAREHNKRLDRFQLSILNSLPEYPLSLTK